VNVLTTGEFYMLNQDIWEKDLGLGWNDNLCIGCLESRIGRKLKGPIEDFMLIPSYPWMYPTSDRMMDKGEWVHPAAEKQAATDRAKRNAKRRRAYRRSRMIAA
jgi:hypothetical protein